MKYILVLKYIYIYIYIYTYDGLTHNLFIIKILGNFVVDLSFKKLLLKKKKKASVWCSYPFNNWNIRWENPNTQRDYNQTQTKIWWEKNQYDLDNNFFDLQEKQYNMIHLKDTKISLRENHILKRNSTQLRRMQSLVPRQGDHWSFSTHA